MRVNAERLDRDELLHLAIRAADAGEHEQCITYLKRALDLDPGDARLYYMLGAEHAHIGLYARAAEEMQMAIELDPTLYTAGFQLGLLHLTNGNADAAQQAWKSLDSLPETDCLSLFKTGLTHLLVNDFAKCAEYLMRGIAANDENAALNVDMRQVLSRLQERLETPIGERASSANVCIDGEESKSSSHVLLSGYLKNRPSGA